MSCMKCGREMSGDGVFCEECLAGMENYPVKPGTAIHLPRRKEEPVGKKAPVRRKAAPSPEEQVNQLRKRVRRLAAALAVCVALLGVLVYFAVTQLLENGREFLPGQNYSSMASAQAEAED